VAAVGQEDEFPQTAERPLSAQSEDFVGKVSGLPGAAPEVPRPTPALPEKPSIAVLPFQNMSGDPGRNISPTALSKTSSQRCRATAPSS
jgi:hypothetical protein